LRLVRLVLTMTLAIMAVVVSVQGASAAFWSIGDVSGKLYWQSYARFARPVFAINNTGNADSCQNGHHINSTLWHGTNASQPVPPQGASTNTWLEVGFMGGINLGNPNAPGCDAGFYYENHPVAGGAWDRRVPMGVSGSTQDYHVRFVGTQIGSVGAYVIINGTGYPPFNDQKCCADSIDVGLELSANNAAAWRAPRTTYQVYYYDLNQQIRSWDGCTIGNPPYPNKTAPGKTLR